MKFEAKKILLIEDDPEDRYLIADMLDGTAEGIVLENAIRLSEGVDRVTDGLWDVVLLDLGLPDSQGIDTVKKLYAANPNIPIIVLTGLSDEQAGIEAVKEGAQDYLIKGQLNAGMLVKAIVYSIERKRIYNEKERLIAELQEALAKVKLLSGFLPICASCKKIRDDKGYWNQIEAYISRHSEAEFSHGICPECAQKLYPKFYKEQDVL